MSRAMTLTDRESSNPIQIGPMRVALLVSLGYGICAGLSAGVGATINANPTTLILLISEPLSFYWFTIVSTLGFIGISLYGIFTVKTKKCCVLL